MVQLLLYLGILSSPSSNPFHMKNIDKPIKRKITKTLTIVIKPVNTVKAYSGACVLNHSDKPDTILTSSIAPGIINSDRIAEEKYAGLLAPTLCSPHTR